MVGRLLALLGVLFLVAGPVRGLLLSPDVAIAVKIAWLALLLVGCRPAWRAPVLIALTPLVPWLPFGVRGLPHGIVHLVVISQALPWLVTRARRRADAPLDPIGWCWAVLLATVWTGVAAHYAALSLGFETPAAFLATIAAHARGYVLQETSLDFTNLVVAATAFLDALLAWLIVRSAPGPTTRLVQTAALTAVGVAMVGVWQAFTGVGLRLEWRLNDPYITRVNATFSDPNALAAYLSAMASFLVALAAQARDRLRLAWAGGAALVAAALVLTAGRMGTIGAVGGLTVLALVALRRGLDQHDPSIWMRRYYRRAVFAALGIVAGAVVVLVAAGTLLDARHHQQQSYLDTWLYTFNLRRPIDETAKGRVAIWRTASLIVADHPVFGVGPGRIFRVFQSYSQGVPEAPQDIALSAHDTFLNIAAELGGVGLGIWLALVGATLYGAWRGTLGALAGPADEERGGWIGAGLLGAWCACLITMTTGDRTILREDLVMIGVLTALIARRAQLVTSPSVRRAAVAAVVLLLVAAPFRMRAEQRRVPLDRITTGLHGLERARDGTTFRWTTGHAAFHLTPQTTLLNLRVRRLAPFTQHVRVLVRGTLVASLTLNDGAWVPIRVVLARSRGDYHRVEVEVTPTWRVPGDGRELGVMVGWEVR